MKFVINTLLWVLLGAALGTAGVTHTCWQFWAILACVLVISINLVVW